MANGNHVCGVASYYLNGLSHLCNQWQWQLPILLSMAVNAMWPIIVMAAK